jgi:hypothetical protein
LDTILRRRVFLSHVWWYNKWLFLLSLFPLLPNQKKKNKAQFSVIENPILNPERENV